MTAHIADDGHPCALNVARVYGCVATLPAHASCAFVQGTSPTCNTSCTRILRKSRVSGHYKHGIPQSRVEELSNGEVGTRLPGRLSPLRTFSAPPSRWLHEFSPAALLLFSAESQILGSHASNNPVWRCGDLYTLYIKGQARTQQPRVRPGPPRCQAGQDAPHAPFVDQGTSPKTVAARTVPAVARTASSTTFASATSSTSPHTR